MSSSLVDLEPVGIEVDNDSGKNRSKRRKSSVTDIDTSTTADLNDRFSYERGGGHDEKKREEDRVNGNNIGSNVSSREEKRESEMDDMTIIAEHSVHTWREFVQMLLEDNTTTCANSSPQVGISNS